MKYVKFLVLNIIVFGALFFFISLLFPSQLTISKAVSITSTKEKVKKVIMASSQWKSWNGFIKDISVERQNWDNMDTMVFTVENVNHQIFGTQFTFYTEQTNAVILNWTLIEKLAWYNPLKKFKALVSNTTISNAMEVSLDNLKKQIESEK